MQTVTQIDFDFCERTQNSQANQEILEAVKPKLNYQCRVLLAAFKRGRRITVADGIKGIWDNENAKMVYIGDVRARVRDLRDYFIKEGIPKQIADEKTSGNYKVYFLEQ